MLVLDMPWSFKLKHSYLVVTENLAFLLWFCSNVNLTLEQLCMEGNRKQAKYAVSAIATLTADSGLKALSVLYGVELTVSVVPSSFSHFKKANVFLLLFSLLFGCLCCNTRGKYYSCSRECSSG
jgi:hypothetical protein